MPKANQTRALIIEKTASLFNKKGFAGATLRDMEKATGLTKGSIYHSFGSKDEVALAVFDFNIGKINRMIAAEMSKGQSAKDKLMAYVTVYSRDFFKPPFPMGGCPLLNTAVEADDTHPKLRKRAVDAFDTFVGRIVSLIKEGVKNKEFRSSVDPKATALLIVSAIEGAVMITKLTGNPGYLKIIMKRVKEMIIELE